MVSVDIKPRFLQSTKAVEVIQNGRLNTTPSAGPPSAGRPVADRLRVLSAAGTYWTSDLCGERACLVLGTRRVRRWGGPHHPARYIRRTQTSPRTQSVQSYIRLPTLQDAPFLAVRVTLNRRGGTEKTN